VKDRRGRKEKRMKSVGKTNHGGRKSRLVGKGHVGVGGKKRGPRSAEEEYYNERVNREWTLEVPP